MSAARQRASLVVAVVTWLAVFGVLQWSVVRFRVAIVVTLTAATALLGWWVVREAAVRPGRLSVAAVLVGGAVLTLTVPVFSYLPVGAEWTARALLALAAVAAALLLVARRPVPAAVVAVLGHAAAAAMAIVTDPTPRIDVWVTLQQATDALGRGENFYAMSWTGSPGIQDAFTYLPWTAVLLAPGRWIAGDVRWALLVWTLVMAVGIWCLARAGRDGEPPVAKGPASRPCDPSVVGAAGVAVLLLVPGTLTQVDQAWTEPLLAAGVVWWAVLVRSGHSWWAVLPLALACASKQHLVLLLPLFLVWHPFGWRRVCATGAAAATAMLPWFIASPPDFVHDTVTLLVGFHAIDFSNTLYLLALNTFGVTPPFWLTGFIVLGTLGFATWTVARRQPDLGGVLRWCALVLAVSNMVNKQAFYNQFWFVAALVVASLVVTATTEDSARRSFSGGQRVEVLEP